MTFPNCADISSAQRTFDAAAYRASGRVAVIIKADEGVGYVNPAYRGWRDAAHAAGLVTGEYHFMGDSIHGILHPAIDEAHHFLSTAGPWTPGRFAVCDVESPLKGAALYGMSPQQAADWCGVYLDTCAHEGDWPGMGYSFSGADVVQHLKAPYLRWLAAYPGPVGPCALHQFTDNGPVPGIGSCDDSVVFVDLAAFAGTSSTPTVPLEDDMAIRIPTPDPQRSKRDPAGYVSPDGKVTVAANTLYECGTLRLYGKGLATVTSDEYPSNATGALCRIAIGSPYDGWGIEYIWIGANAWEVTYDSTHMKGKAELAVTVYGETAAPVTVSSG